MWLYIVTRFCYGTYPHSWWRFRVCTYSLHLSTALNAVHTETQLTRILLAWSGHRPPAIISAFRFVQQLNSWLTSNIRPNAAIHFEIALKYNTANSSAIVLETVCPYSRLACNTCCIVKGFICSLTALGPCQQVKCSYLCVEGKACMLAWV